VAVRHAVAVDSITLWLLGGVSKLRGEAPDPASELRIAAAGPATSLGLAGAFGLLAALADGVGAPPLAVATATWLAIINAALALFNLVPAAPLDGGRLLHALVWRRTGDHAQATRAATTAGRWFGIALAALGTLAILGGDPAGLWFLLLGWFLFAAARAEASHELLHGALGSMHVSEVMTRAPIVVSAHVPVAELVDDWFVHHHCSAFPVVDGDGRTIGLVTLQRVRTTDRRGWDTLRVQDVADELDSVATVSPDDTLSVLVERVAVATGGAGRALVLEAGELVGIVSPTDVRRAIEVVGLHRAPRDADRGTSRIEAGTPGPG
jgi:Zn-dependent protease